MALTAVLLALAAWLTVHRDFGGGLLQARPGHPRASRLLGTPVGLALRTQRGLLIGWAIGLAALGLLYGAVIPTIPDLVASNPDDPAAQAVRQAARGIIAMSPIALPVLQEPSPAAAPQPVGLSLPMAG